MLLSLISVLLIYAQFYSLRLLRNKRSVHSLVLVLRSCSVLFLSGIQYWQFSLVAVLWRISSVWGEETLPSKMGKATSFKRTPFAIKTLQLSYLALKLEERTGKVLNGNYTHRVLFWTLCSLVCNFCFVLRFVLFFSFQASVLWEPPLCYLAWDIRK